jgi:hypothetical protein
MSLFSLSCPQQLTQAVTSFIFERCSVRISVGTPTITTEVSNSFPQFVQADWLTVKLLLGLASKVPRDSWPYFTVRDTQAFRVTRRGKYWVSILYPTTTTSIHIHPNSFSIVHSFDVTPPESVMPSWNKSQPSASHGIFVDRYSHYARLISYVSCASSQT